MECITKEKLPNLFIKSNYIINRRASASYFVKGDKLNVHNIVLVYGGEGEFTKNGQVIKVSSGDLCYFERGCKRTLKSNPDNPLHMYTVNFGVFYVNCDFIKDTYSLEMPSLGFDFVKKVTNTHTFDKLVQLFERLISLYLVKNGDGLSIRAVEQQILNLVIDLHIDEKTNYAGKKLTEKAIKFMQENLKEKITLNDICGYCKTSPSHLGKMFREVTDMSTIDYLIKLRLEKSKSLLAGGMSVSQVAEECGFSDVYYFSSCFKKNEKISPLKYAKMSNEEIINNRYT